MIITFLKRYYFETDGKFETVSFKTSTSAWKPVEVLSSVSHCITLYAFEKATKLLLLTTKATLSLGTGRVLK